MTTTSSTVDDIATEFKHFYVKDLHKRFGGVHAVNNVSFALDQGQIAGLIGPNGAGKTTVFNLITGMDAPDSGDIYFDRTFITGQPAHKIVRQGIARTFQNIRLLGHLSVLDNIKIAYHYHFKYRLLHAALRLPSYWREEREITRKSLGFLRLFDLEHLACERADSLAYGQRRRLEIARALATEGKLLLLDEPAAGMNPSETTELMQMIRRINQEFDVTILLIEHDMKLVMSICQHIVVMDHGSVIAAGQPDAIKSDPRVIEAYLGAEREPTT